MTNGVYLTILTVALWLAYICLAWLYVFFFSDKKSAQIKFSWRSILLITVFICLVYLVSLSIADQQLSNRLLHFFGGGVLAYGICLLAVRDNQLVISRLRFFIFSLLVVTSLGVANELLEFFLQQTINFQFSANPFDTWWDLLANTSGALFAAVLFLPWLPKKS